MGKSCLSLFLHQSRSINRRNIGSAAARLASTSVAKRSSGGFFGWLTGERSNPLPPLGSPLPGVSLPPPLPDYVEPGKTKITTLPNGVKIASETSAVRLSFLVLATYSTVHPPNLFS